MKCSITRRQFTSAGFRAGFGLFAGGFFSSLQAAQTIYVAQNGSDGNSGQLGSPVRTVQKGLSLVTSGGSLQVGPGTWAEPIPAGSFPSGSAGAYTIIRGTPGQTILSGSSGGNCVSISSRQYVTLADFILDGNSEATNIGLIIGGGSSYITAQGCEVRRFKANDTGAVTQSGGPTNSFLLLSRLIVHDNGLSHPRPPGLYSTHGIYMTARDTITEYCESYNNNGMGYHQYYSAGGSDRCTVRFCNFHDNYSYGAQIGSGSDNAAYDNTISNNARKVPESGGLRILSGRRGQLARNKTYGNGPRDIMIEGASSDGVVENNCVDPAKIVNSGTNTKLTNNTLTACGSAPPVPTVPDISQIDDSQPSGPSTTQVAAPFLIAGVVLTALVLGGD